MAGLAAVAPRRAGLDGFSGVAGGADRALEQLGLRFGHLRRPPEGACRVFKCLGLAAQGWGPLLEQVKYCVERSHRPRDEVLLQPPLALQELLDELELALHRG